LALNKVTSKLKNINFAGKDNSIVQRLPFMEQTTNKKFFKKYKVKRPKTAKAKPYKGIDSFSFKGQYESDKVRNYKDQLKEMKEKFLNQPLKINTTQDITINKQAYSVVKLNAPF